MTRYPTANKPEEGKDLELYEHEKILICRTVTGHLHLTRGGELIYFIVNPKWVLSVSHSKVTSKGGDF
jgi:hypothetical protein